MVRLTEKREWQLMLSILADISKQAFSKAPWNKKGRFENLISEMFRQDSDLFVVEKSSVIAGFAIGTVLTCKTIELYRVPETTGSVSGDYHLTWRAVLPSYQTLGIGTMLVDCRVERARQLSCRYIHANTEMFNYSTRRLLQKLGFEEIARTARLRDGRLRTDIHYRLSLSDQVSSCR
jgi:ribosomal protein S18 acetylase RimI-like enzyme